MLSELRKGHSLTQEALAAKVGVSVFTISRWETGVQNPGRLARTALAKALGISAKDLDEALLSDKVEVGGDAS